MTCLSQELDLTGMWVLVLMRLGLYPLLLAGWASNRKYALIGGLRGVAQTLSYEVRLVVLVFGLLSCRTSFSIVVLAGTSRQQTLFFLIMPMLVL